MEAEPTRAAGSVPHWALEWLPAREATCRKGGCPDVAAGDSEWCRRHLEENVARRAEIYSYERPAPSTSRFNDLLQAIKGRGG